MTLLKQVISSDEAPPFFEKKRLFELDLIRVVASVSVIAVHVATPVVANSAFESANWWIGNIYESLFRSGIPLFLMLTGALLLPRATGFMFIKKRVIRVLLPFLIWTAVYLVARNKISDIQVEDYFYLLNGEIYFLWYVYLILIIYILMPLLRFTILNLRPSTLTVIIIACLTTSIFDFIPVKQPVIRYCIELVLYLTYVAVGYCMVTNTKNRFLNSNTFGLTLIISGFLISFAGTYFISAVTGSYNDYFYENTTTHLFLKAVGAWILLRNIASSVPSKAAILIGQFSKFSFGIYLIHILVIEHLLIVRLGISHNTLNPAVGILLITVLSFTFSTLLLYILNKLPFGKYTH